MQDLTQTNVIHHVKISEKCHIITIDSEKLFDKNFNFVRNSQTRNKKKTLFYSDIRHLENLWLNHT